MGYKDARLAPDSKMSPEETIDWTAAADPEEQREELFHVLYVFSLTRSEQ
jgi:hypothetical protein